MNPTLLFWVPALMRLAFVLIGAALVGWFASPREGLATAVVLLVLFLIVQLQYLYRLAMWLDEPNARRLPDGWGAWTDIFARLYRMRRADERHQAELVEWLARFRQAMRSLPDGVAIMDDELFLEWCNAAAEQHLGLTLERDHGMRVTNLVRHPDFIDYVVLGRYEKPLTLALRGRKLVVQIIPFESRRQILVTHDATEADRIEVMRRDFIANASHELRTPLTVIVGFLEIALGQPDLDPQVRQQHLRLMTEQGKRMQRLIDDMLTLSRLESADYPIRAEEVDVQAIVQDVAAEARALSNGKHEVTVDTQAVPLMGSSEELRSAFGNLASNAVRYTPEGGKIHIRWADTPDGPTFQVSDTGIGIERTHIARLTERFYRVDKSRSRETQGTGLGLAIVKHVMLRHGARLDIASDPGKGSTFSVTFPPAGGKD